MGKPRPWASRTSGPDYWKGEAGRKALISGKEKFTDKEYVDVFKELASWGPYMGDGYQAQKYADTQNLFSLGRAAIYPAGSWDIPLFEQSKDLSFDAFPPVQPEGTDKCYISDHVDIGMGVNAKSKNVDAAKTFIDWVGSAEFAGLYANALPGFFPLTQEPVEIKDPGGANLRRLAQELREHDPELLPDPLARHAEPRERALGGQRQCAERHADAGSGCGAAAEGSGRLVQARPELS